ncbi:Piso0_003995 [Millerozyma farinosa CBS 7064]|uniref:Piso0_003995 protein n=1 Tax=Pichia sorbitophila (strain ATCC MYA-4447 / BCRC 22081 / CBS 7064 / NBRC 10061 / NRRL Y-12695) TaxID=559304 RepID=G8Y771_PICSO|nr:Piso0_003995 [Millerozyma farinosa CBS 7064]CCE84451.1 Piso0_003995 [Millerozyma farinosa CBS 7064]
MVVSRFREPSSSPDTKRCTKSDYVKNDPKRPKMAPNKKHRANNHTSQHGGQMFCPTNASTCLFATSGMVSFEYMTQIQKHHRYD